MTLPEILKELDPYTGKFPEAAVRAAIAQREAITPELLRVLGETAANPAAAAKREDSMSHVYALHLLAQFREQRAYPLVVRMFSAPGETSFDLAGDTVTEALHRILASVFDGNLVPLLALAGNAQANEFVRSAAIRTLLVLERNALLPREQVVQSLRELSQRRLEKEPSYAWDALVGAIGDLPAPELLEEARRAYREGWADPSVAGLQDIEKDANTPLDQKPEWQRENLTLMEDAVTEMEWWASFHPDDQWSPPPPDEEEDDLPLAPSASVVYPPPKPVVAPLKIGRNDPCPCGSGLKYKKCCLGKGQVGLGDSSMVSME